MINYQLLGRILGKDTRGLPSGSMSPGELHEKVLTFACSELREQLLLARKISQEVFGDASPTTVMEVHDRVTVMLADVAAHLFDREDAAEYDIYDLAAELEREGGD